MASNINQHNQLLTLLAAYAKRLDKLYDDFITRLVSTFPYTDKELWDKLTQDPLFRFDDLPYLSARLQHIFNDFVNNQVLCYKAGITDGVALAYSQDKVNLGKYTILQDEAIKAARAAAVASFIANRMSRKEGLSLSDKVWNYAQLGKSEVEMGISNVIKDGLKAGTSAEELGRKVRQYLNNPTMMYRRYWVNVALAGGGKKKVARWYRRYIDEKTGKVTFKQEPLEKVGTGVYRSARMNSYRLMRTEINMSYHKANASRWAKEPFVYGIRVWLSPQHPKEDICDDLEGYYPADFCFTGWHPNCMCASAPLTLYGDEKRDFYRRLMKGEDMSNFHSKNEITKENMNPNWWKYIDEEHKNIIKAAERGKLAYHLRDNQLYWLDKFSPAEREKMGLSPMSDKDRIAQIAAARHAARTPEQAKDIADRWHEHKRIDALIRQAEPLIADLKEYPAVTRWRMLQTAVDERDGRALSNFLSDKLVLKKLEYEKMITPEELKWSNYVKNFISTKSATVVHNTMANIVKEAREEKSAKDAIDYLKGNMKKRLLPNLVGDEVKVFQPMLDREVRRMQDWFDYKSYAKSMDMLTELVNKNAATIGGAFKPLPFTSSDFYFQDIKKMRSLVNDKYYDAYMNLLKWNNASEFVAASRSPIVHQLYDGILNAYKTQGFTSDVEDMVNKLLDNIERLKKEAEKKMSFAYMQKDFATTSDIEETLKSINATLHGLDKWFQNGDCRLFVEKNKRYNGCTMMDGRIWLTQPRIDKSLSAFQKLAQKKAAEFTEEEADAMATFWHEITHNRNIPGNMRLTSLQTRYMELANEYVARNTLPEFYAKLGVKDMPHKEFILTRESTGYNTMVTNYEYVVKTLDLDKDKVLSSLKKSLFENKYDEQKESLINALIDGGIKMANGKPVKKSTLNSLMGIVKDQKNKTLYSDIKHQFIDVKKEDAIKKWLKEKGLKAD